MFQHLRGRPFGKVYTKSWCTSTNVGRLNLCLGMLRRKCPTPRCHIRTPQRSKSMKMANVAFASFCTGRSVLHIHIISYDACQSIPSCLELRLAFFMYAHCEAQLYNFTSSWIRFQDILTPSLHGRGLSRLSCFVLITGGK